TPATPATVIRLRLPAGSPALPGQSPRNPAGENRYEIHTTQPTRTLHELTAWALEHAIELGELEVARPSLEDAYLALMTAHSDGIAGEGTAAAPAPRGIGGA
nr:hypothetical protein [Chloroflexota bacterium]